MARATDSVLKLQRSSSEPPPRPTINRSAHFVPAEVFDAAADFFDRVLALHGCREEPDVQPGKTAGEDLHHIRDGRAAGRSDDADALRESRQRTLAGGVEEPFSGEFLLELFEGDLQRAARLEARSIRQSTGIRRAARRHRSGRAPGRPCRPAA